MTKEKVLRFIFNQGGSVDWHPLVEFGALPIVNELVSEGMLTKEPSTSGVTISLTEHGKSVVSKLIDSATSSV